MKSRVIARQPGFTLIEVLVAITILSMVMLATVTGLRTLASSQLALERQTAGNDAIRSTSTFLRDALEAVVVGSDTGGLSLGGGQRERTVFEIGPQRLIWKTRLLFGESAGGSYVVRLAREGDELVLRWQKQDDRGVLADWNIVPSKTLATDVQSFSLAYRRQLEGPWLERWDGRGPPSWLRLRIRAAQRFWPDLVVEVTQ